MVGLRWSLGSKVFLDIQSRDRNLVLTSSSIGARRRTRRHVLIDLRSYVSFSSDLFTFLPIGVPDDPNLVADVPTSREEDILRPRKVGKESRPTQSRRNQCLVKSRRKSKYQFVVQYSCQNLRFLYDFFSFFINRHDNFRGGDLMK